MNNIQSNIQTMLKYEIPWCKFMGFFNPYVDPFEHFISKEIPDFDGQAFYKYTKYNFVYDKLWISKSQGLMCGELDNLKENKSIKLPIFVKPRWGHETASSKNCYKIKSWDQIEKYKHIPNMMWSEFIDAKEQMTDYILLNGVIVYQITYIYSESQNEFIDDWKYISPKNKPIPLINDWVNTHLSGFTGAVNVQYRSDKIIEVGLRLARGGAYITSTKNKYLIENINSVVEKGIWNYDQPEKLDFEPFYSFKCYSAIPALYVFPQYYINYLMKKYDAMPFYEYYFEPSGKMGLVVFQFMHKDFKQGMKAKKHLEMLIFYVQILFILLFLLGIIVSLHNKLLGLLIIVFTGLFFNTKFLNPIEVQNSQFKAFKQYMNL